MTSQMITLLGSPFFKNTGVAIHTSEIDDIMKIMKHADRNNIRRYNLKMKMELKKINEADIIRMSKDDYSEVATRLLSFHVSNFFLKGTKIPCISTKLIDEATTVLAEGDGGIAHITGPDAEGLSAKEKADGGVFIIETE
jgi:hypothetical protein